MGTVLLTGFAPYGGRGRNPSAEVVAALDGSDIAGHAVRGVVLPVALAGLRDRLAAAVRDTSPRAVVSLGLYPGEPAIRLERVAVNHLSFEIPDNEGAVFRGPARPDGPAAYLSRLPLEVIQERLLAAGIPSHLSGTAGAFLCNALMYHTLDLLDPGIPAGFVHLPYLPAQVATMIQALAAEGRLELGQRADLASMALETIVEAVQIVIATTVETVA
ncbi:MAG: pyroglutamyl-peptidase I [Geminicoccaceae bacterium]